MSDVYATDGRMQFVWVKDRAGNEFVCPVDALKDPNDVAAEELRGCVEDAKSPHPYAGG